MSSDRLDALLRELPVPASEPALERTVRAARERTAGRRRTRRRRGIATGLLVLASVAVATPAGQAGIRGVGELVGLVGDRPTLTPQFEATTGAMIVDTGRAPDGSGYEWVAGCGDVADTLDETQFDPSMLCVGLDWPGHPKRARQLGCSPPKDDRWSFGLFPVQAKDEPVERADLMLAGETRAAAHDVRVLYTDADGVRQDLPVDFERIDGAVLERAGGKRPFGVYMAFVTAEQAARDGLSRHIDVAPGTREQLAMAPPADEPEACRREPEPRRAPFEVVIYDRDGGVVEHLLTTHVRLVSEACNNAMREQVQQP